MGNSNCTQSRNIMLPLFQHDIAPATCHRRVHGRQFVSVYIRLKKYVNYIEKQTNRKLLTQCTDNNLRKNRDNMHIQPEDHICVIIPLMGIWGTILRYLLNRLLLTTA